MPSDSGPPGVLPRSRHGRGIAPRNAAIAAAAADVMVGPVSVHTDFRQAYHYYLCGCVNPSAPFSQYSFAWGFSQALTTAEQEPASCSTRMPAHQQKQRPTPSTPLTFGQTQQSRRTLFFFFSGSPEACCSEFSSPSGRNTHNEYIILRQTTQVAPPPSTTIALTSSRVLSAVHALVLLAALLFYRAFFTPSNRNQSTMSVSGEQGRAARERERAKRAHVVVSASSCHQSCRDTESLLIRCWAFAETYRSIRNPRPCYSSSALV